MTYRKQEYPPLLEQGLHEKSLDEIERICVTDFPSSNSRRQIMAGFRAIYERLVQLDVSGEIWIDGSFLTSKDEPEDVDFVVIVPSAEFFDSEGEKRAYLDWLNDSADEPKHSLFCHTQVIPEVEPEHPYYRMIEQSKQHFLDIFGHGPVSREPKGIVLVRLPRPGSPCTPSSRGKIEFEGESQ